MQFGLISFNLPQSNIHSVCRVGGGSEGERGGGREKVKINRMNEVCVQP